MNTGPRYDNAMKAMCTHVPRALCQWLGLPVRTDVNATRLSEMATKPATRQVDAIMVIGDWLVVHLEFQAYGETFLGWRMIDYRSLLVRRPELKGKRILQYVSVLGGDRVDEGVHDDQVDYSYTVHYLRDHPVDEFLAEPSLAPFAALADLSDEERADALGRALDLIATVADDEVRTALAQATVDLAAIRLDTAIIKATWEDSAMPIPSFVNNLYEEGVSIGRREGRQDLVADMLRERFGADDRIPAIAPELASLSSGDLLRRLTEVSSLDELL
jgi:hypothetical protein